MTPYWSDWRHRLPFYIPKGIPVSIPSLENKFKTKFDLVIEFDSSGQYHLTGKKQLNIPTLMWSMDTHLYDKRAFQAYFKKDFDILYTCHKNYVNFFNEGESRWLPCACDPDFHRKLDLPKIYDVAFVGNLDPKDYPERVKLLENLSKKFNVRVFNKLYGEEMIKIVNQAKIVFNKTYGGDLNFRIFEVLSCGTFLITDRIGNGLQDLFGDGKHLAMYDNPRELEDKVSYYLTHDREREEIASNGQKEVRDKHTFYHRAKTMLDDARRLKQAYRK